MSFNLLSEIHISYLHFQGSEKSCNKETFSFNLSRTFQIYASADLFIYFKISITVPGN